MKRVFFWVGFIVVIVLIVWGLIVAMAKPLAENNYGTPAEVTEADHIKGPASSSLASTTQVVTLIEYGDFQCPACSAYYSLIERLITEASTTLRFVYRHFPLAGHQNALLAARASEAAANQDKFWQMSELLFTNQTDWSEMSDIEARKSFESYASEIGLDLTEYKEDLDKAETRTRVDRDKRDGETIGLMSTPSFAINGKIITNPRSYEEFKAIIETAALANPN